MMKTLNQLIEEGFTYPETIDEPTATLITDWFGERYTGSMFTKFFDRSLNLYYPYYRQLLRVDPTVSSFDWFVDNYEERQSNVNESGRNTSTKNGSSSVDESVTVDNTESVNSVTEHEGEGHDTTVYNSADISENASMNNTRNTALSRTSPMSYDYDEDDLRSSAELLTPKINGVTAAQGDIYAAGVSARTKDIVYPKILNPSAVSDGLTENSQNGVGSVKKTGDDRLTKSDESRDETNVSTGFSGTTETASSTRTNESGADTSTIDRLLREIRSGRNQDLSTLIDKAVLTIQNTVAWEWLYKNLDKCFIQTYIVKGDEYEQ